MDNRRADDGTATQVTFPERASITIDTDALQPATDIDGNPIPEPQWEYGISWDKNYPVIVDEEQDEDRIREEASVNGRKLLRRRVGPWEPVEEERG